MICRRRPGFVDIRSVSGDVTYEVDLHGETATVSAALDDAGERLAVVFGREWAMDQGYAEEPLLLIHLKTGESRVIQEGLATGPVWFPGEDRLAFSNGTAICLADVCTGSVEEVFRFAKEPQEPADIRLRPDGKGLAFLKWVGDHRRIGVVDLDTGAGRVHPVACSDYCWWDTEAMLYVLGAGLRLLDVTSGKSRVFLKDLTPLDTSGVLKALGEDWVRAVHRPDAQQDLRGVLWSGNRVYFGAAVCFPLRRTIIPFIRRPDPDNVQGVLSMTREKTDLRLHLTETPGGFGITPINHGRTLAINVYLRRKEGWLEDGWAFVGEGAEGIPQGFGPLPRASFATRGDLFVGDFPRLD